MRRNLASSPRRLQRRTGVVATAAAGSLASDAGWLDGLRRPCMRRLARGSRPWTRGSKCGVGCVAAVADRRRRGSARGCRRLGSSALRLGVPIVAGGCGLRRSAARGAARAAARLASPTTRANGSFCPISRASSASGSLARPPGRVARCIGSFGGSARCCRPSFRCSGFRYDLGRLTSRRRDRLHSRRRDLPHLLGRLDTQQCQAPRREP